MVDLAQQNVFLEENMNMLEFENSNFLDHPSTPIFPFVLSFIMNAKKRRKNMIITENVYILTKAMATIVNAMKRAHLFKSVK